MILKITKFVLGKKDEVIIKLNFQNYPVLLIFGIDGVIIKMIQILLCNFYTMIKECLVS